MDLLPRPPETFLGRESELTRLSDVLAHRHLFLITGLAGIGKTSLALALLHRQPGRRGFYLRCLPDGGLEELAAALEAASGGEAGTASVRDRLLIQIRWLNQSDRLAVIDDAHLLRPADLDTLVKLLQTYLSARVVLVSREDLPVAPLDRVDIFEQRLEELPPEMARLLLERLLALHPGLESELPPLGELASSTGGYPLLIKLLASLIVSRRLLPGKLSEAPAAVRDYLLREVLGQVGSEERRALELLALSPVGLPGDCLGAALETLEKRFLVQRDAGGGVLLHQLLAGQVAAGLGAEMRRQRCLELAELFTELGQSQPAFELFLSAGQETRARELLEQVAAGLCSRGQYQFVIGAVERVGRPDQLAVVQANALSCLGRSEQAEALLLGRADSDLKARISLAGVCLNTGRYRQALQLYGQSLEGSDRDERLKCLNYMALIQAFRGELKPARATVDQSLQLAGDGAARAHALRISATVEALAGRYETALAQAQESFELARELGMARLPGLARFPLGLSLFGLGRRAQAVASFEDSLREARLLGDTHLVGWSLMGLGVVQRSEEAFQEAARQFELYGNKMGELMAVAGVAALSGADRAGVLAGVAEQAGELGNPWLQSESLHLLAQSEPARQTEQGLDLPGPGAVWLLRPLRESEPAEPVERLRLRCLGDVRLEAGRRVIGESDWPTRKALRLFARLAHRRGAAHADGVLVEAFWPEADPTRGRSNLRHALHQIRTVLRQVGVEQEVIRRSRKSGTVEMHLDASLDLEDFETRLMAAASRLAGGAEAAEQLQSALELYRGDFLASFDEPWVEGPRAHYLELRLRAHHQLARCRLALGQGRQAEETARAGLAQDDLREELHIDLIEALALQNRKGEALRQYRDTLAHFEKELGLIPRSFEAVYPLLVSP